MGWASAVGFYADNNNNLPKRTRIPTHALVKASATTVLGVIVIRCIFKMVEDLLYTIFWILMSALFQINAMEYATILMEASIVQVALMGKSMIQKNKNVHVFMQQIKRYEIFMFINEVPLLILEGTLMEIIDSQVHPHERINPIYNEEHLIIPRGTMTMFCFDYKFGTLIVIIWT
ncbi:hypothetical protein ACJX0J_008249, partial [Zea mays]